MLLIADAEDVAAATEAVAGDDVAGVDGVAAAVAFDADVAVVVVDVAVAVAFDAAEAASFGDSVAVALRAPLRHTLECAFRSCIVEHWTNEEHLILPLKAFHPYYQHANCVLV